MPAFNSLLILIDVGAVRFLGIFIVLVLLLHEVNPAFAQGPTASATPPFNVDLTTDPVARIMVRMIERQKEITDRTNPTKACDDDKTKTSPKTEDPKPVTPQMVVYECSCEQEQEGQKKSLFAPSSANTIRAQNDNDNKGLGLWGLVGKDGDDRGYTNGLAIAYTRVLNNNDVLSFELNGSLYTGRAEPTTSRTDPNLKQFYEQGLVNEEYSNGIDPSLYQQNIEDVTRLMVTLEKPRKSFYYRMGAGVEYIQTDPSKFSPNWDVQNAWHSKVLGKKNATQYQAIGANGIRGEVTIRNVQNTRQIQQAEWDAFYAHAVIPGEPNPYNYPVLNGYVLAGQPNPNNLAVLDRANHTITRHGQEANIKNGVKENKELQTVGPVNVVGSFDVGKRMPIFGGACELQLEAGGFLSTSGKKVIGPNTYIHMGADVKSTVLKRKNGDPRVNAQLGTRMMFFPTPKDYRPNLGFVQSVGLESYHRLGKGGATISPFIMIFAPTGRKLFQELNTDNDSYMRFGFKVGF